VVCGRLAGQSSHCFSWEPEVQIGVVNVEFGQSFLKQNEPPGTIWRRSAVHILVLLQAPRSVVDECDSVIDVDSDSLTSDVEEHLEGARCSVLILSKNLRNSIWSLSKGGGC
jgi:Fe-S cluster assembly ATPase SufC